MAAEECLDILMRGGGLRVGRLWAKNPPGRRDRGQEAGEVG